MEQNINLLLETREVTKTFGGVAALHDLNVKCSNREILGIIGPNGAGKTTLFNVISGLYKPDHGEIIFMMKNIEKLRPHRIAQLGIGRTFQVTRPFKELTVLENVCMGLGCHLYARSYAMFQGYRKKSYEEKCLDIIKRVGLENHKRQPAKSLPIPLQRRLEIARVLALDPKLMLLDEPFSGLTHEECDMLIDLIKGIRNEGKSIMLVEHNMEVAMQLCDRIVVLDRGTKISEGPPSLIVSDEAVIKVYLGED